MLTLNLQFRRDPTRTLALRRRFMADAKRRLAALKREIATSIVERDCFGIRPEVLRGLSAPKGGLRALAATPYKAFEFKTDAEKLAGFMEWLRAQEAKGILEIVSRGNAPLGVPVDRPWTNVWIDSAYQQGIRRAGQELRKAGYKVPNWDQVAGGWGSVMNQPIHAQALSVIYSRTFEDLKSVMNVTDAQVRRTVATALQGGIARGLAEGKNPLTIARELVKDVNGRVDAIGITRARMIARTEVANAHHQANINEYQAIDAELEVDIIAEWGLGPDPCPICQELAENAPYTLEEIRNMIPAHPNCVCVAIPKIERSRARKVA